MARRMVCEWGMSVKLGPLHFGKREGEVFLGRDFGDTSKDYSEQTAVDIDAEIRAIVSTNYDRAKKVILENLDKLKALAEALLEHETIDGAEIDIIFSGQKLERKMPARREGDAGAQGRREAAPAEHLRAAAARARQGLIGLVAGNPGYARARAPPHDRALLPRVGFFRRVGCRSKLKCSRRAGKPVSGAGVVKGREVRSARERGFDWSGSDIPPASD